MDFAGEGNFLKKVFLPPHPYPSKTFKQKLYLALQSVLKHCVYKNFICYFAVEHIF